MRTSVLIPLALAATIAVAAPVLADVTFDVAVNVVNLAPEVQDVVVDCAICTTDCEQSNAAQTIGTSTAKHSFIGAAVHTFNGKLTVVIKPKPGAVEASATDYICSLKVANAAAATFVPGTGGAPNWAQPQPGMPLLTKLKGKLPRSK